MLTASTVRYSIAWDNTQKLVQTRDQSRQSQNQMMLWANAYAVQHRVHCPDVTSPSTLNARQMPVSTFLPNTDDYAFLRQRMMAIFSRILVHHVDFLRQSCASAVAAHIPHQYSQQSALKSTMVKLFYDRLAFLVSTIVNYSLCAWYLGLCATKLRSFSDIRTDLPSHTVLAENTSLKHR